MPRRRPKHDEARPGGTTPAEARLLARVLANAHDDWAWGWCLGVNTSFAERRVRAGEEPTAADFEAIDRSNDELVAKVVGEVDGVLPPRPIRDFDEWQRRRA